MRIARSTGVFSGALIVLLGIWGGLVPFVGPYFSYSFGRNEAWYYTSDRLWLSILPGALAIVAGILVLRAARRASGAFGGWLATLAGAWFAVGPAVSLTWEHGPGPIGRPLFSSTRQMLELVGYFYGLGALIVALGAFAIGRFTSRPPLAEAARVAPASATAAGAAAGSGAEAGARQALPARRRDGTERRRVRRGLPFRRRAREDAEVGPPGRP